MQGMPKKLHRSPRRPIAILSAGNYSALKGVDFPPHHHSHWELVYYWAGAVDCVMEGTVSRGYPGLIWLTPPGVTHAENAVDAYACHYVALELPGADRWPVYLDDDADRSVGRACQQIIVETRRSKKSRGTMLDLLAEQLGFLLRRVSSERSIARPEQIVARAEAVIEERCGQSLTIREVAKAVHSSPSALRGYFKSVRGCSPRQRVQQVRLGKAIGFLRTSTLKLEAVAEVCGYDSASHLTRCVKKAMGKTPGEMRR
jgi:AraC-like DNA-binding protein